MPVGSGRSIDFITTMFVRAPFLVVVAGAVMSVGWVVVFVVLRMCWRVFRMWPFAVGMEGGRCLLTRLVVKPGKVVRNPLMIALVHVVVTGLQHAW